MFPPDNTDDKICLHKCEKQFEYLAAFIFACYCKKPFYPFEWKRVNCKDCAYILEHLVSKGSDSNG